MEQVSITGIDLAKSSFQLHGARVDGSVAFRKKPQRNARTSKVQDPPLAPNVESNSPRSNSDSLRPKFIGFASTVSPGPHSLDIPNGLGGPSRLRAIMAWAQAHGYIKHNVAGDAIAGALPTMPAVKEHFRAGA